MMINTENLEAQSSSSSDMSNKVLAQKEAPLINLPLQVQSRVDRSLEQSLQVSAVHSQANKTETDITIEESKQMPKILYEQDQQHPPITSRSRKTNRNNAAGDEYEYYDEEYDEEEAKEERNDYDFRDFMDDTTRHANRIPAVQVSDMDIVNNTTS